MLDYCTIYIIKSKSYPESFFSFVSEIFNQSSSSNTVVLELDSQMIEISDMTKYESKDYKLELTKKYNKLVPIYLDFLNIPSINSIYFLSEKIKLDYSDPYTCEYVESKTNSNPVFTIKQLGPANKFNTKYLIGWNSKIIERDLLIHLLEWIFVKN